MVSHCQQCRWIRLSPRLLGFLLLMAMSSGLGVVLPQADGLKLELGGNSLNAAAQSALPSNPPLSLHLQAKPLEIQVGDPLQVEVELHAQKNIRLEPINHAAAFGDWEILQIKSGQPVRTATEWMQKDQLVLTTYVAGKITLPGLKVRFHTPAGQVGEYHSAPLSILVKPLPQRPGDKPGQIRGLKAPRGMFSWFILGLSLLFLMALAGSAWWVSNKYHMIPAPLADAGSLRSPEEIARERLAALRDFNFFTEGAYKAYYIQLTDILRHYLEARLQVSAIDRTTHELIWELKSTSLRRPETGMVRDLLEAADLVKFAKAKPSEKEARAHWQVVSDLVERISASFQTPAQDQNPAPLSLAGTEQNSQKTRHSPEER